MKARERLRQAIRSYDRAIRDYGNAEELTLREYRIIDAELDLASNLFYDAGGTDAEFYRMMDEPDRD